MAGGFPGPAPRSSAVVRGPDDLTLGTVERIAWGGDRVTLHATALSRVARGREALRALVSDGARVYGLNTGTGFHCSTDLEVTDEAGHAERQRALLLGRAVGGPPYLPAGEARAVLAVRLVNLLSGAAGVTPRLCTFIADRLNDGFTPAIPRTSIGCAGEVIPLAHAFQTLVGVGTLVDGTPAAQGLATRGVRPYEPASKEGIALLAGAPGTVALGIGRLREARMLTQQMLASAACAIDALRAPLDSYDPQVARLAPDPLLAAVLARLGVWLEGSSPDRKRCQAPVSFRVVPQVHTHLERAVARLDEDVRRALASVTDSPAVTDGGVLSTGAFHAVEVAASMDGLTAAYVRAAELAAARLHRLLDHRFSGLADQLTPVAGPRCGLVVVHKRAVGAVHELRRLATPTSVGLVDTSLGQEDALAFGYAAAENLRHAGRLAREVLACELLACRQAWWLRAAGTATGLQPIAHDLSELVPPVDEDRPLGPDITRLITWLERGGTAA